MPLHIQVCRSNIDRQSTGKWPIKMELPKLSHPMPIQLGEAVVGSNRSGADRCSVHDSLLPRGMERRGARPGVWGVRECWQRMEQSILHGIALEACPAAGKVVEAAFSAVPVPSLRLCSLSGAPPLHIPACRGTSRPVQFSQALSASECAGLVKSVRGSAEAESARYP